ncbi:GDSL esterase/lipase 7 [Acorus calamus]|uniref:GDSL esterase/lipase 7 n=1 Tax=Acorus calamus TaxID=4465 RepID=A0AAV9EZC9_ACOCL|nr:GDSL esterase/lipase 7 [Acorus calamus]
MEKKTWYLASIALTCLFALSKAAGTPAMFIFGDSLIDDGNNNFLPTIARANYAPYGIDFGAPTGRFCNGLTVVDYGARILGLPFVQPYLSPLSKTPNILKGANYASAAAGILDETGRHYLGTNLVIMCLDVKGGRMTFNGQIALFEKTVKLQLPLLIPDAGARSLYLARSVFVINIGSNDYINNYLLPGLYTTSREYSGDTFADHLISNLSQQLMRLYRSGARKMVLVNIGPLGCIPSQLSTSNGNGACVERINELVIKFNERFLSLYTTLNSSLPGSFFVHQDIYQTFSDMIRNPANYGFRVTDRACCGSGRFGGDVTCLPLQPPCASREQYLFWDSFHPTQAANAIIADRCYSPGAPDCKPISITELAQI